MNRLLLMTGAAATLALTADAATRLPASSFDSDPAALDTRIGTVGLCLDQKIDSRVGSSADSDSGKLDTFNSPGLCIIFR